LSIDFTGGTLVQGFFEKSVPLQDIRKALDTAGYGTEQLQSVPSRNAVIMRYKVEFSAENKDKLSAEITTALNKAFADNPFTVERVEFVGPVVGKHLIRQAFLAIIFSMAGIAVYVGIRFKNWIWGVSGVLALLHDVFFTMWFMSVLNREMSITVIAALLTIAGYSINDTIVIFDRMREGMRSRRKETLEVLIDRSLNETLSRTIITALTVFIVLVSLLFFGGDVIRDFSLAMTFGMVIGSYSSLFLAAPMVYAWQMHRAKALRR